MVVGSHHRGTQPSQPTGEWLSSSLAALAVASLLWVPQPARKAISLASAAYGVPRVEMVSVARCETGGDFNPRSYNRSSGASPPSR